MNQLQDLLIELNVSLNLHLRWIFQYLPSFCPTLLSLAEPEHFD